MNVYWLGMLKDNSLAFIKAKARTQVTFILHLVSDCAKCLKKKSLGKYFYCVPDSVLWSYLVIFFMYVNCLVLLNSHDKVLLFKDSNHPKVRNLALKYSVDIYLYFKQQCIIFIEK